MKLLFKILFFTILFVLFYILTPGTFLTLSGTKGFEISDFSDVGKVQSAAAIHTLVFAILSSLCFFLLSKVLTNC